MAQAEIDPEILEDLTKQIEKISEQMKELRNGRLSDRAVVLLLQDITGLPMGTIWKVLNGMEDLARTFLKDVEED